MVDEKIRKNYEHCCDIFPKNMLYLTNVCKSLCYVYITLCNMDKYIFIDLSFRVK